MQGLLCGSQRCCWLNSLKNILLGRCPFDCMAGRSLYWSLIDRAAALVDCDQGLEQFLILFLDLHLLVCLFSSVHSFFRFSETDVFLTVEDSTEGSGVLVSSLNFIKFSLMFIHMTVLVILNNWRNALVNIFNVLSWLELGTACSIHGIDSILVLRQCGWLSPTAWGLLNMRGGFFLCFLGNLKRGAFVGLPSVAFNGV